MDGLLVSRIPQAIAIRIEGEIDLAAAPRLAPLLHHAATGGGPMFLDLRGVSFMDSSALKAYVDVAQELANTGWCLELHATDGPVRRILEIADLERVDNIHVSYDTDPDSRGQRDGEQELFFPDLG
jgi:anti-sigma B factor antagonist